MKPKTLFLLTLLFSFYLLGSSHSLLASLIVQDTSTNNQLIFHDPIIINHNDNFTQLGFQGVGTDENPFLIQNLKIVAAAGDGINISDVTHSFVIENCYIESPFKAISLSYIESDTNHFIIKGNVVNNSDAGIYAYQCNNIILFNNTFVNGSGPGMLFNSVENLQLERNIVLNNIGFGVMLVNCLNTNITSNIIYLNMFGGLFLGPLTSNILVLNNIFYWNIVGNPLNAQDEGSGNHWSDDALSLGNSYSDWDNEGVYLVPGPSGSIDFFPTNDTDGDSMHNGFELAHKLDPLEEDDFLDYDWDGLDNGRECELGTDPKDSDSDDDGYDDGTEVAAGSDPLDPNSTPAKVKRSDLLFFSILVSIILLSTTKKMKRNK
jgi:parallel beta-helix repeat protein